MNVQSTKTQLNVVQIKMNKPKCYLYQNISCYMIKIVKIVYFQKVKK